MKNKAIFGTLFALLLTVACGQVKSIISRSDGQSVSEEQKSDPNFALAGLGDASCLLTYQLVRKVTGMSSAPEFYEADSQNLVSRSPMLDKGFGGECLSFCRKQFESLTTRYGANRVLLRNCNFERIIATASVKGLIETFTDSTVKGFACKYGQESPVDVEIFLGGAPGVGVFAGRTIANLAPANEIDRQLLAKQCSTAAALHRFSFVIPDDLRTKYPNKAIFVNAIDAVASNKNFAIGDSGKFMLPGCDAAAGFVEQKGTCVPLSVDMIAIYQGSNNHSITENVTVQVPDTSTVLSLSSYESVNWQILGGSNLKRIVLSGFEKQSATHSTKATVSSYCFEGCANSPPLEALVSISIPAVIGCDWLVNMSCPQKADMLEWLKTTVLNVNNLSIRTENGIYNAPQGGFSVP